MENLNHSASCCPFYWKVPIFPQLTGWIWNTKNDPDPHTKRKKCWNAKKSWQKCGRSGKPHCCDKRLETIAYIVDGAGVCQEEEEEMSTRLLIQPGHWTWAWGWVCGEVGEKGGRWMKSGAWGCVNMELPLCGREADHRVRPPMEGTKRDSSSTGTKNPLLYVIGKGQTFLIHVQQVKACWCLQQYTRFKITQKIKVKNWN